MLSLLILVLIGLLIVLVLCWVIQQLPLPANVQKVAMAIVALIFLLWILQRMGIGL